MDNNMKNNSWILSNRYKIIEQVGIGGMSYVYKALDNTTGNIVAIKLLKDELASDDEFIKKFKSEAIASEKINHQNVVRAFDVVDDNNLHYIVLEYVDGITLNKYIKDKGCLSNEETVKLSIEIASGLASAHSQGIIHRDIKPQNIVIKSDGTSKIMDFGIARAVSSTTRNISIVGTVHYISPEQARNENVDFRSDIYSLGCTMYEMITGDIPFPGDNPVSIIVSHLRENIKKPSEVNKNIYKSLEKIILKCTQMLPKDRYQSMNELITDLKKALVDKEGSFVSDSVYNNDTEDQTMIISDSDMKLIKDMSKNYQDNVHRTTITEKEKEYVRKYIDRNKKKDKSIKILMIATIIFVIIFGIIISYYMSHNRFYNNENQPSEVTTNKIGNTNSAIIFNNLKGALPGLNIDDANNLAKDYGIILHVGEKEFSDTYPNNSIIRVVGDDFTVGNVIEIVLSMGKEFLDFSDIDELNNTKFEDMEALLKDRNLSFSVVKISDRYVPEGNIIGVNKKSSDQKGSLTFTVSLGSGDDIVVMPQLVSRTYEQAVQLLEISKLSVGAISYMRSSSVDEGKVIAQSIETGKEIVIGTSVDITLSSGANGQNTSNINTEKWVGNIAETYVVTDKNIPANNINNTVVLAIRLVQETSEGTKYIELTQPQEYRVGTSIPLVYVNIEGATGVTTGFVQVVDVENDKVLSQYTVTFKKEG